MFAIEKDVPLPRQKRQHARYPLGEMEVGDSFFVPCSKAKTDTVLNRVRAAFWYHKKKNGDKNFIVNAVKGGLRCWRIA